jgi:crotonobetainyl-CoA:carnitine CoA-transferase CaiB-like acyl-CoA transferase
VLVPLLAALIAEWDKGALLAALDAGGVPAGPINTLSEVFENPQVRAREMAIGQVSAVMGDVVGVRCPLLMSGGEVGSERAPPGLGEHTAEVLAAFGVGVLDRVGQGRSKHDDG